MCYSVINMADRVILVFALTFAVVAAANVHHSSSEVTMSKESAIFGRSMLAAFQMDPDYVNFNYGSFGSVPRVTIERLHYYHAQMEARPDIWLRSGYRDLIVQVRRRLASYVGASAEDIVLVENTSSGVNAVLRSLKLQPGDKILSLSIEYPMVRYLLSYLVGLESVQIVEVPIRFPVTGPESFVDPIRAALDANPDMRLVIISHISSTPAFVLPAQEIVNLCRARGVRILVDGAHALGQLPLDLTTLNPDYYVSNAHKWLYSPKGSAFLFVSKQYQSEVIPTVISSEFGVNDDDFQTRFLWTGTRDYSALLSIDDSLNFRESIGGDQAIYDYVHGLAWWAANYLKTSWNTTLLAPESVIGFMFDVQLPLTQSSNAGLLQSLIYERYGMYITAREQEGQAWSRLSAQIFLEQADFILLGERVAEIARELNQQSAQQATATTI